MSVAVIFPGFSPSNYEAVGHFMETDPHAQRRLRQADEVLGFSLLDEFREAGEERWEIHRCAYLVNSLALADWAEERLGMEPSFCVGESFGGIPATVYLDSMTYQEALKLTYRDVLETKRYFEEASNSLKALRTFFFYRICLPQVQRLVREVQAAGEWMEITFYYSENIYAVCASEKTIEQFKETIRKEGGAPLYVMDRPVHSSVLTQQKQELRRKVYDDFVFRDPRVPLVSDVDGLLVREGSGVKEFLLEGVDHPVRWHEAVRTMERVGVKKAFVVGPRSFFGSLLKDHFDLTVVNPETATKGFLQKGKRPRSTITGPEDGKLR